MISIPRTPLDLEFVLFNVPVHVNGTFWIMAFLLSWGGSDMPVSFIIISMLAIFVSLVAHEMGHAMANMRYGYTSQIVLYYMGGLATSTHMPQLKRLVVVLAGPAAGFMMLFVTWLIIALLNRQQVEVPILIEHGLDQLVWINLIWTLLNLLPIFPLDGGQAVQSIFLYFSPTRGALWAAMSSFLFAVPILVAAVMFHLPFVAIYAAMFGYQSYQEYQSRSRRGH